MGTGTTADVINSAELGLVLMEKEFFIVSHSASGEGISQISLTNAFDTSSFVIDGKFGLDVPQLQAISNQEELHSIQVV